MQHHVSIEDRSFRLAVEVGGFPLGEFNHRAHIRLAYVYLAGATTRIAQRRMRETLQAYLKANQVDDGKYHETITQAWIRAVRHFMQQTDASTCADDFIGKQPQLLDTTIMFKHYSADLLFSTKARAGFVSPDLQAIPEYEESTAAFGPDIDGK